MIRARIVIVVTIVVVVVVVVITIIIMIVVRINGQENSIFHYRVLSFVSCYPQVSSWQHQLFEGVFMREPERSCSQRLVPQTRFEFRVKGLGRGTDVPKVQTTSPICM